MALTKCHECGKGVSTTAKACPNCGAAPILPKTLAETTFSSVKCPQCQISVNVDQENLSKCPSCHYEPGAAKRTGKSKLSRIHILGIVVFAPMLGILIFSDAGNSKYKVSDEECASSLRCQGDKVYFDAQVRCRPEIEKLASHRVQWSDSKKIFKSFDWSQVGGGLITFTGDEVEFQNGFGAYSRVTYTCLFDPQRKMVMDVGAKEGRLAH